MLKKLWIVAPLLAAMTPAHAANLVVNGGFETGALAPWTQNGGNPVVTSVQAHTGQFSVAAFSGDQIRQNFAATATSSITDVSFWVLREGGPFNSYSFFYDDNTQADFLVSAIGQAGWQFFNVTSNLAANKNLTGFRIFGTTAGPAYLDDFRIDTVAQAVPEPATWGMMISGFALVGASMRRRRVTVAYNR